MKAKCPYFILSLLLVVLLSSCLGGNKNYEGGHDPGDPSFYSLIFYPGKGNEGLGMARFRLELDSISKDSIIVNRDSLPYLTKIDSVTASFTFVSSSKLILSVDNNERAIKHNDKVENIDFSKPMKVINTSGNKKKSRTYQIKVNVHSVDPDVYQWEEFSKGIKPSAGKNQKALMFNDKFLFFSADDAHAVSLSESEDARQWSERSISFTPALTNKPILKTLTEHNNKLYLLDEDGVLYRSDDANNWTKVDYTDSKLTNLLFSFKDKIWGIAILNNEYFLSSSSNGSDWKKSNAALPFDFPVIDYSTSVFKTTVGNPRVILLGSSDKGVKSLHTRWSTMDPATNWVKYPEEKDTLSTANNAVIVKYDNRFVLFGGKNTKGESIGILESYNGGLTWKTPNEEQMSLPEGLRGRLESSAFVSKDNKYIYIIGGVKGETSLSDVWRVHLNKITFKGYKAGFGA